MIEWFAIVLPFVAGLGILAVLGLPAAIALGVRGVTLALVAVPAAFAVITVASIALPLLGLPWTVLTASASALFVALVLLSLRRWVGSARVPVQRVNRLWPVLGAAAIGGAAVGVSLILGLKGPDHVSQSYDAIFHLNAVRFILDTGSASPFEMTLATGPAVTTFYPTPWHGFVALIVQLTGAGIPLATNAAVIVVSCVLWPLGIVALSRAIAGPSTRVTLVAGILAAAFPSFPLLLVRYGVLYPNLLATALVPYALVGLLALLNLGPARRSFSASTGTTVIMFIGATGAAATAHPNAFFAFAIIAVMAVFSKTASTWRMLDSGRYIPRVGLVVGLLAMCVSLTLLWSIATTSDNEWEGKRTLAGALWEGLGSNPQLEGHAWVLTVLTLGGVVLALLRKQHRWLIAAYAVLLALYGLANGMPTSAFRTAIIGLWYNDAWRIAAVFPLVTIPLSVLALSALAVWLRSGVRSWRIAFTDSPRGSGVLVTGVAVVLALAATQGAGIFSAVQAVSSRYSPDESPKLLSTDEQELLERLDETVPEDAVLATNPWNGGSLAYAIAGRTVLAPHTGGIVSPEVLELTSTFAAGGERVCELVHELDVTYVLDFGRDYVFPGTPRAIPFEGISDIEESTILQEVDREGDAVLYEVVGCRN